MKVRIPVLALCAMLFSACNWFGDGGDATPEPQFDAVNEPFTASVSTRSVYPIRYAFPQAGHFEVRVTGTLVCQTYPSVLSVGTQFSDSVLVGSGEPLTRYELSDCTPSKFSQQASYTLTAPGPWFVDVQLTPVTAGARFEVRDLQLGVRKISD